VVTGWGKYFAKPIVSPGERERDGVLLVGKVTLGHRLHHL